MYALIWNLLDLLYLKFALTDRKQRLCIINMSRTQCPSQLCCLIDPDGKCSACRVNLCAECFDAHFQKNDHEVQLKFTDALGSSFTYWATSKCSFLKKPAIYVQVDTVLKL